MAEMAMLHDVQDVQAAAPVWWLVNSGKIFRLKSHRLMENINRIRISVRKHIIW